jgi:beta-N-acetylhexosaminidase
VAGAPAGCAVTGSAILAPADLRLSRGEARGLAAADPWGFIVFSRNIESADQLRALTAALRDAVGREAPVLIDQEGGRVQRLRPPLARDWPPPLDEAAAGPRAMWLRYRIIAAELMALGIDVNCGPCADLALDATHPFLRNRCYGGDPAAVAANARAVADGLLAGGVLPVLKHVPGHGRATADSHLELPRVVVPRPELAATDFAAFRALADLPLAMTAHVVYTALDPALPATLSPAVLAAIRGPEIGFEGLLMSDDLGMGALGGPLAARAQAALAAGCDLVLHCSGDPDENAAVADAAGGLSPAAAARAARALAARRPPDPVDIPALAAELESLRRGGGDG